MSRKFVELEFYETYYHANVVSNIIEDPYSYIRLIHEWYEDYKEDVFLPAFPKRSRLHGFAAHIIETLIHEKISDPESYTLANNGGDDVWIDRALKHHNFPCDGFADFVKGHVDSLDQVTEDHLFDYHQELSLAGHTEMLVERLTSEVFYILFSNRKLLALFNEFMARGLGQFFDNIPDSELGCNLSCPGVLKRVGIPAWVKRAVFFRDRGMCSLCQKDLSGIISTQPDSQYDHIISLAAGGLNDVTNIQLLCQACNGKKSKKRVSVSNVYEAWY